MCCSALEHRAIYHRQGPFLVCQSRQYRFLERHVTKKSHISPLTRARTIPLFAGADTMKLLCSHPLSRACAVAAAELSALAAKSSLASGTVSSSRPEFRLAEWDGRCEGGNLFGVCYPFEDRRLQLGGGKMGFRHGERHKCWRRNRNCILSLLIGEGKNSRRWVLPAAASAS